MGGGGLTQFSNIFCKFVAIFGGHCQVCEIYSCVRIPIFQQTDSYV